jgi:hypothetical protein
VVCEFGPEAGPAKFRTITCPALIRQGCPLRSS